MSEDETYETEEEPSDVGQTMCCPRCGSKNVIIEESKSGYFWVELCRNCGYKGKEGDKVGCAKEDRAVEPSSVENN